MRQLQIRNQTIGLDWPVRIGRNSHFLFHLLTKQEYREGASGLSHHVDNRAHTSHNKCKNSSLQHSAYLGPSALGRERLLRSDIAELRTAE